MPREDADSISPPPDSPAPRRLSFAIILSLRFLSAIPDATVVPVLKGLLVDRYAVSPAAAHAFMAVNLIGGIISIGFARRLHKFFGTSRTVALAALFNGLLLAVMALPIGFYPTLLIRIAEGAMDLIVYALLFAVIGNSGAPERRGMRMGAAATAMMLGIASGLGLGGIIGQNDATLTLWLGAVACMIVSTVGERLLPRRHIGRPDDEDTADTSTQPRSPLWPTLAMMFTDRALSGVLTTTIPLYFTIQLEMTTAKSGGVIGIAMLMLALGAFPAGKLADVVGPVLLRLLAGIGFASCYALLPFIAEQPVIRLVVMAGIGLTGAALFACSLELVSRSNRGVTGMHALHAAGNLGFFVGPIASGALLWIMGDEESPRSAYLFIMVLFAVLHTLTTIVCTVRLMRSSPQSAADVETPDSRSA
ncbi:MAG: MFS transporter [Planctomycetota bacterium]